MVLLCMIIYIFAILHLSQISTMTSSNVERPLMFTSDMNARFRCKSSRHGLKSFAWCRGSCHRPAKSWGSLIRYLGTSRRTPHSTMSDWIYSLDHWCLAQRGAHLAPWHHLSILNRITRVFRKVATGYSRGPTASCVCVYPGNAVLDIHIKAWYAARYTANLLLHLWDCGAYETATALQLSRLLQLSSHGSPAFTPRKEKEGRFCES